VCFGQDGAEQMHLAVRQRPMGPWGAFLLRDKKAKEGSAARTINVKK